ncbi:SpoIID/LytB domain protein [Evansella vedderi]|uniref:SpoIID/LytB domain protein n=1 Tax=Evansella vedderi TaxID=38282 RepID=A0ABT9ZTY9_9BACI|nr:SpoIID/LytB domain-containing protein [Evansella vedderi]MDQ0254698.1 SpoIID/LytB domain protein [Evansella vedderi]
MIRIKRFNIFFTLFSIVLILVAVAIEQQYISQNNVTPFSQQVSYNPLINVELVNYLGNVTELSISLNGAYTVNDESIDSNRSYRIKIENGKLALYDGSIKLQENTSFTFKPNEYNQQSLLRINNRPYLGDMQFAIKGSFIRPVNTLPLEDYLKGVVPHEMPASWAIEALKVQAIAARTYAMAHIHRVINDTINYQVYAGYAWHPNSTRAVTETAGETIHFNNSLALTVYSSSNGGRTESNANAWGGQSLPYFPIKDDPYDPIHPWNFRINKIQIDLTNRDLQRPETWWDSAREVDATITNNMKAWLSRNGYPNSEIKITSVPRLSFSNQRTSGGRVRRGDITVEFAVKSLANNEYVRNSDGSLRIHELRLEDTTAQQIRAMIGISLVRSYLIDSVEVTGSSFIVSGRGFGHGVGMSQWGAKGMADQGASYQDILQFYYPGTKLVSSASNQSPTEIPTNEPPKDSKDEPIEETVDETSEESVKEAVTEILLTINSKTARVNGQNVRMLEAPFLNNGRTLVPLRFVSEQLGANVHWNGTNRTITITDLDNRLVLRDNSRSVTVNGRNETIDVAPQIIRGTTFVPLRFISEQLNGTVHWNPTARIVHVKRIEIH